MSKLLERCRDYGVDVDGVMERFLEDEELFQTCLETFYNDTNFVKLGETIKKKEYKDAFNCVHTLKGVAANLGLTALFEVTSEITEQLRANNYEGLDEKYEIVCQERTNIKEFLLEE